MILCSRQPWVIGGVSCRVKSQACCVLSRSGEEQHRWTQQKSAFLRCFHSVLGSYCFSWSCWISTVVTIVHFAFQMLKHALFFIHKRKSQREEKLNMCSERRNSTQTISVWLNFHNITHSGMNKLWGPVPSSMAPLCRCHLRNNRNAHSLQPSLTPQAKAWTES